LLGTTEKNIVSVNDALFIQNTRNSEYFNRRAANNRI